MSAFLRYIFWIAIAGGIIYGGYYAYQNWWNEGTAKDISNRAIVLGETATQKAGEYAKSVASTTETAASSFLKNKIGNLVSVVGEQLTSLGAGLSGVTSPLSVGGAGGIVSPPAPLTVNVPIPTSSAFNIPPPPATIVVSVNEQLSFSINSGQVYKMDWGDGEKDQGATSADNITVLRHSWASVGDYIVRISVGNSVTLNIYSFPIRVY